MIKKAKLLCCTLACIVTVRASAAINPDDFKNGMMISFPGFTSAESVENFPMPVFFDTIGIPGFSYSDFAAGGADLRFADSAGNELPYEIDTWNTNGESLVWVSVPELTSSTAISAYWGNGSLSAPDYSADGGVWKDYLAVWHMSSSDGLTDSTTNNFDAVKYGSVTADSAGKLGRAINWTGAGGYKNDNIAGAINGGDQITVESVWTVPSSPVKYAKMLSLKKSSGENYYALTYHFEENSKNMTLRIGTDRTALQYLPTLVAATKTWTSNTWNFSAGSVSPGTRIQLENDTLMSDGVSGTVIDVDPLWTLTIGYRYDSVQNWKGNIDELRIALKGRSATWLRAVRDSAMSNSLFAAYSLIPKEVPTVSVLVSSNGYTRAVVSCLLASHGGTSDSSDIYADLSSSPDFDSEDTVTQMPGTVGLGDTLPAERRAEFIGLIPGGEYYVRVRAVNNHGVAATNFFSFVSIQATPPVLTCTLESLEHDGNAVFNWTLPDMGIGNTNVIVWIDKASDTNFTDSVSVLIGDYSLSATGVYTNESPALGEIWYFRVRGEGLENRTGYSEIVRCVLSGTEWWIDCRGSGAGTASNSPSHDLFGIMSHVQHDDIVNIRGGEGREYVLGASESLGIYEDNVVIRKWGEEKPLFRITGKSTPGSLIIGGNGVLVSGLRFVVEAPIVQNWGEYVSLLFAGFYESESNSVFNSTVEDCDFEATGAGTNTTASVMRHWHWNDNLWMESSGTNFVMRGCYFADFVKPDVMLSSSGKKCRFERNIITNCANIFRLANNSSWVGAVIVSNRIYNPVAYGDSSLINGSYGSLSDITIAHNLVWNDRISNTNSYYFMMKGSLPGASGSNGESLYTGDTKIYNNTIYGLTGLMRISSVRMARNIAPFIANNLIINPLDSVVLEEYCPGKSSTEFTDKTRIMNNIIASSDDILLYESEFTNACPFEANVIDNYKLNSVSFIETRRSWKPDFMSPRGDVTKEVRQGLGTMPGYEDYPKYVGAIAPTIGQATTILILR